MDETTRPRLAPPVAALLIAAPALMVVGRLLLVPFNDQGWDAGSPRQRLAGQSSDAGWLIAMAASGLLAATALSLSWVLYCAGRTKAATFTAPTCELVKRNPEWRRGDSNP